MDTPSESLRAVLEAYARFLRERQMAQAKHQTHLVR